MPVIEQVLDKYPNEVKFVFKNFPLNSHKFARQAAIAALAAGKQGKFWQFHDKLFQYHNQLSQEKIHAISLELGLDTEKFVENMKDSQLLAAVERDIVDGNRAGVRGTPAVFVNGKLLRYMNFRDFQDKIEKELQKK